MQHMVVQGCVSEHVWEALTPKNYAIPTHPLNLEWLARRIKSFKAKHSGSLKTPALTPKFRLVQNSTPERGYFELTEYAGYLNMEIIKWSVC